MKRAFFCLFVIISIAGCKKEESLIQSESYKNKMAHAVTRSIVETSTESETNPTLISDWENIETVKLNSSSIVTVPWVTGASTALSGVFCKDIKKEDGWMMLFHTFKRANLDIGQNYMCFYNMFTGYLKFFYYYEGDN